MAEVDLAKEVIPICQCKNNKVHSNFEINQRDLLAWLFKS